jgi:hypothetical protein
MEESFAEHFEEQCKSLGARDMSAMIKRISDTEFKVAGMVVGDTDTVTKSTDYKTYTDTGTTFGGAYISSGPYISGGDTSSTVWVGICPYCGTVNPVGTRCRCQESVPESIAAKLDQEMMAKLSEEERLTPDLNWTIEIDNVAQSFTNKKVQVDITVKLVGRDLGGEEKEGKVYTIRSLWAPEEFSVKVKSADSVVVEMDYTTAFSQMMIFYRLIIPILRAGFGVGSIEDLKPYMDKAAEILEAQAQKEKALVKTYKP